MIDFECKGLPDSSIRSTDTGDLDFVVTLMICCWLWWCRREAIIRQRCLRKSAVSRGFRRSCSVCHFRREKECIWEPSWEDISKIIVCMLLIPSQVGKVVFLPTASCKYRLKNSQLMLRYSSRKLLPFLQLLLLHHNHVDFRSWFWPTENTDN